MKTTGRILTTLGIGAMVLGLAAFRSPATLQTAVPSTSSTWAQTRMSPASLIQTSMNRSALAPATGTPTVASYAGDQNWRGQDRDRDHDKWKNEQQKRKREQLERERREQAKRRAEWLKKHKHDNDHRDHDHDHR